MVCDTQMIDNSNDIFCADVSFKTQNRAVLVLSVFYVTTRYVGSECTHVVHYTYENVNLLVYR